MKKSLLEILKKNCLSLSFALCFCLPILSGVFFLAFNLESIYIILNSFLAPLSVYIFLKLPKALRFYFGFYIGLLLFYWIALSFRFSPLPYVAPFVMLAIALIYAIIFGFLLWFENLIFRILSLFLLSYIHPFYFDWLFVESFFAYSIFGVDKFSFICIVIAIALFIYWEKQKHKKNLFAGFVLLFLGILQSEWSKDYPNPLDIELVQTQIPQDLRWNANTFNKIVEDNFSFIISAIKNAKQLVILPETAFPIALNQQNILLDSLQNLSYNIGIVTGGLREEGGRVFNSTYIFYQGRMEIIDKVVLAPFGEKIPLPDFLAKPLHKIFFGDNAPLQSANLPKDFLIENIAFRNAICYEATSKILYFDNPKYVVVISNNAWFYPSIEPFFQQILLKYYARMHKSLIVHSANYSKSMVITPSLF